MTPTQAEILQDLIYPVVDEINDMGVPTAPLAKDASAILFGTDAVLDSMGLVSFVVAVEDRIEDVTECRLTLADERAMSRKSSPFRSIGALAEYVEELLAEARNG